MGSRSVRNRILAGLLLAASSFLSAQEGLQPYLRESVRRLESRVPQRMVVALGTFTYEDKKIGSGFSKLLESELALLLADSPRFELFDREKLGQVLEAVELSLSDLSDPAERLKTGQLKSIQGLISGRFFERAETVQVFLQLTGVETGTVLGSEEALIPRNRIPTATQVQPTNLSDALHVIEELAEVENARNEDFVVKVWTLRGDGGTYVDGESLVINFYSNRECFIKMYHVDVRSTMQLIFPNEYYSDNLVKARRVYRIPDSRYPFAFILGEPFGTEFIKVIASTTQFKDVEQSFQPLGAPSRGIIKRGLQVRQAKEQLTEAMISYTILGK